jgi:hypothetical protein
MVRIVFEWSEGREWQCNLIQRCRHVLLVGQRMWFLGLWSVRSSSKDVLIIQYWSWGVGYTAPCRDLLARVLSFQEDEVWRLHILIRVGLWERVRPFSNLPSLCRSRSCSRITQTWLLDRNLAKQKNGPHLDCWHLCTSDNFVYFTKPFCVCD